MFLSLNLAKKVFDFSDFFFVFLIFFIDFFKKNLDLIFSILDLEISIPDLENSKRAFRKKTPNLRKFYPNFRQFFAKNFTKIPKWNFRKIKVFTCKFWVGELSICIRFFLCFKKFVIPLWTEKLVMKNYAYGKIKRKII